MRVFSLRMFGWCAAMIRIFVGFLTVTRTMLCAGTRSPSRRGWRASRFTAAGAKRALAASVPAG
jgi:hypothetical protein